MDFDEIEALRRHSPAWRLLCADNAPLILSFLAKAFIDGNVRSVPGPELVNRLDDELFALNERLGDVRYPKQAKAYLDDWAAPAAGWLRKFYPTGSSEVHFDVTPAVEKALAWVKSLRSRSFVGTESRLNTVFDLLRQMAFGTETDPEVRLAELHRQRTELDITIERLTAGDLDLLDASALRDRYQQFSSTARELLADFREVEANFRALDRQMRERIAAWGGSKGQLLDEVLGSRDSIAESDQGRSFHAFYDFLLSPVRQAEFTELLRRVHALDAVGDADPRMRRIHYDWLDAGERTQATVRLLSEQLRRFLDDQVWLENRRVMDILRGIESTALKLRDVTPDLVTSIDGTAPAIVLPMERPMYRKSVKVPIRSGGIESADEEVDTTLLFGQVYVDPLRLAHGVRQALRRGDQVGLRTLLDSEPLEQGLAELVTYLSLTDPTFTVVFDERVRERLSWEDGEGLQRVATLPVVTFVRTTTGVFHE